MSYYKECKNVVDYTIKTMQGLKDFNEISKEYFEVSDMLVSAKLKDDITLKEYFLLHDEIKAEWSGMCSPSEIENYLPFC